MKKTFLIISLIIMILVCNFKLSNIATNISFTTVDTNITTTITEVESMRITYITFGGMEKTGYIDREKYVANKFDNYNGVNATTTVYSNPELTTEYGEIYDFGWLWNCEETVGYIYDTTTNTTTTTNMDTVNSINIKSNLHVAKLDTNTDDEDIKSLCLLSPLTITTNKTGITLINSCCLIIIKTVKPMLMIESTNFIDEPIYTII